MPRRAVAFLTKGAHAWRAAGPRPSPCSGEVEQVGVGVDVLGPRAADGALHTEEDSAKVRFIGVVFGEKELFQVRGDGAWGVHS